MQLLLNHEHPVDLTCALQGRQPPHVAYGIISYQLLGRAPVTASWGLGAFVGIVAGHAWF